MEEYNLRSNKNTGEWDYDLLANFDEDLLKDVGWESEELDKIFNLDVDEDDFDTDAEAEKIKEPKVKLGDLYQLGEHRLLCGDATKKEDVEKLMGGGLADMVLTDPPYSVDYKSRKEKINATLKSYQDPKNAKELLLGFMGILPSDILIMTYGDKNLHNYVLVCEELGFETIDLLVWVKQNFCFWPGARYQQKHELIFITRKIGSKIINNTPSNQSTIFEIDRNMKNNDHPTQKPMELFEKLLKFHSNRGNIVYEPFCGSGTTLMCCENLKRKCRAIEISPLFCEVIINRWEKFTGNKAKKI